MHQEFLDIHIHLENIQEKLFKGTQLYFSPLKKADILFIGINPGIGYFKYKKQRVKRFNPLQNFEYAGQKYYLAIQTKKIFKSLGLGPEFNNAVKINQFPFATTNETDLNKLLDKHGIALKLQYISREFVLRTIEEVNPKLIICEGKSSFDRLKLILNLESTEYNDDTFISKHSNFTVIGYKRYLSFIKNRKELSNKIKKYYLDAR